MSIELKILEAMHKSKRFMYATEIERFNIKGVSLLTIHSYLGKLVRKGLVAKKTNGEKCTFIQRTLYGVVERSFEEYRKEIANRGNKIAKKVSKNLYAPEKPCATCKTAARVHRSYCRACLNAYNRESEKRRYYRLKKERLDQGIREHSL